MFHLDQERARHALEWVRTMAKAETASKLRMELSGLPALIAVNGLMTVLVHGSLKSEVQQCLDDWLRNFEEPFTKVRPVEWGALDGGLLDRLHACDEATLQRAWEESIQYATWLKRWAAALMPAEQSGRTDERAA